MKTNAFSRIAAVTCVAWGIAFFYLGSRVVTIFEGMDDFIPRSTRMVFFVGPLGWLLFSILGALLIIRFRASRLSSFVAVGFLSVAIAATCTLLFTGFSCPRSVITPSPNPAAPGNGAMAFLLQIRHLRRAVPEQYR